MAGLLQATTVRNISCHLPIKSSVQAFYHKLENTNNQKIIDYAVHVQNTFHQANILFFNIHRAISHSRPIDTHEIKPIQDMIDKYMTFYRDNASQKIFPNLHFLEHHSTEWITRYGFGMGLHGVGAFLY